MELEYQEAVVKPGREFPIKAGHPWIFSQGVASSGSAHTGDVVRILSPSGEFLGLGTFHAGNTIRIRMLTSLNESIDTDFFSARFRRLREAKLRHIPRETDGYRLVHGDADFCPGLIVDVYSASAVFQIHTAGMEPHRLHIIQALSSLQGIGTVVERSDVEARKQEGLKLLPPAVHAGEVTGLVPFQEAGLKCFADVVSGQKTGFYLDQRDARLAVRALSRGRRVTNLFSYSCAFGLSAAAGGAKAVLNVDASRPALDLGKKMFEENGFSSQDGIYGFEAVDVFKFLEADPASLREGSGENLLICDPPAFAKSASKLEAAKKAYIGLNRLCLESLSGGDIFVTSSCSGMLSEEAFRDLLRHASGWAKRNVRVLGSVSQPADHTQTLSFPEGRYLKTLILEVL